MSRLQQTGVVSHVLYRVSSTHMDVLTYLCVCVFVRSQQAETKKTKASRETSLEEKRSHIDRETVCRERETNWEIKRVKPGWALRKQTFDGAGGAGAGGRSTHGAGAGAGPLAFAKTMQPPDGAALRMDLPLATIIVF
ncbi:hypothetical protein EVAR_95210_1 [Eumeta japonica]|uniref:Uncharacterized protein n=1 Tax=Eumeta variegata TaxID=151549 RepID=A0A4C1VHF3_EUMVA|nr:hypothetical protein EVAR_95210_1 [Eumeta japonica]